MHFEPKNNFQGSSYGALRAKTIFRDHRFGALRAITFLSSPPGVGRTTGTSGGPIPRHFWKERKVSIRHNYSIAFQQINIHLLNASVVPQFRPVASPWVQLWPGETQRATPWQKLPTFAFHDLVDRLPGCWVSLLVGAAVGPTVEAVDVPQVFVEGVYVVHVER